MMYPQAQRPPVQEARLMIGAPVEHRTEKRVSLIAPRPSRMEQRPVVLDKWGFMGLAGNEGDREVVPVPQEETGVSPIACAVGGFLLVSLLS